VASHLRPFPVHYWSSFHCRPTLLSPRRLPRYAPIMSEHYLPARSKLLRREFNMFFELYTQKPWLTSERRKPGLESLLDDLCQDLDEQALVCELLYRFMFLDSNAREPHLTAMVNQIVNVWHLRDNSTQVVAVTIDDEGDSAQAILQELKPRFVGAGWPRVHTVNKLGKARKRIADLPDVVLVDEFSGTGNTIRSRVRQLRSDLSGSKGVTIRVCLLAGMEDAIQAIRADGVQVFAPIVLQKGISRCYSGNELASARTRMRRLESDLAPQIDNEPLPSFGYGGAEALFSTDGNPPNSTFPIFWWPRSNSGKPRKTIFYRR
jgi:hypothetical protein